MRGLGAAASGGVCRVRGRKGGGDICALSAMSCEGEFFWSVVF